MKPDININGPWGLHGYSDAGYAGDNDTWKIMPGYIILITEQSSIVVIEIRKKLQNLLQKIDIK